MPRNKSEKELALPQAVSNALWLIRQQPSAVQAMTREYLKHRIPKGQLSDTSDDWWEHWHPLPEGLKDVIRHLQFEDKERLHAALST